MAAQMLRPNLRDVLYLVAGRGSPPAKIHILEPYRMKIFVQPAQVFPHVAPCHQERAGRLLHRALAIEIPIQVPIAAIHRITRPEAVNSQEFECQGSGRRKPTDGEPRLCPAVGSDELPGGQSMLAARFN